MKKSKYLKPRGLLFNATGETHLKNILEYKEARDWIADSLTFNVNVDVNLFECTIRVLGSMLSGYHLTNDELYKEKAVSW